MSQPSEPDFLCIGLQKAGTGWLYDQLQHHPDFWMPPIKEFHYFDRNFPDEKLTEVITMAKSEPRRLEKKRARQNWRPMDERDYAFLADAEGCAGLGVDLGRYASLFRHKGEKLSGDITPAYSTLQDETVSQITQAFPRLKVLLLLRDPVSRVWSQISMSWRRGKFDTEILEKPSELLSYLETAQVRGRSFATEIFGRWSKSLPESRLRYYFLDQITSDPDAVRRQILSFLGADPDKTSGELEASFNRKSTQEKLELNDSVERILVEFFAAEIVACAELFGGSALDWKKRYNL